MKIERRIGISLAAMMGVLGVAACGSDPENVVTAPELVLLISVDTLRADHLGFMGAKDAETPHIDALANEGVVFEHAYAPASFTVPAITTMLTGYYPEQNAVYSNEHVLPEAVPTLAAHLAERGYAGGAVVSNFVLRGETGLSREFDRYDDRMPERESARGLPERTAQDTTSDALAMLERLKGEGGGRVFLWVHYQDPHGPYTPDESERKRFLEQELEREGGDRLLLRGPDHRGLGTLPDYQEVAGERRVAFYKAGYRAEIAATDRAIGDLIDGVKSRMDWSRTLAVFAADHGEGMGERDYWFAHGEYLDESLTRVPLVLKVPGIEPKRRKDAAGLVDLVPTLLPRVGLSSDPGLPGRDLLARGAEAAAGGSELYLASLLGSTRGRVGLIADGYLYVATQMEPGRLEEELFVLGENGPDVSEENSEQLKALRARLGALRPKLTALGQERRQSLSESDRAAMRALGYTGDH